MRAYFGPNPYAPFPVIVADIGCGLADDADVVRVRQRMEKAFPGWMDGCPRTLALAPAHALAEIAAHWSKSLLNSVRGLVEGAGTKLGETGSVELWVGFHVPQITATAIEMSTRMVRSAIADPDPFPAARLEQDVVQLQSICRREHPDYIARILMLAARAADIPVLPSPIGHQYWQYGWGCNGRTFFEACAVGESITGYRIAGNKALTTRFLKSMGFPVTAHLLANTVDEALLHARALGWPLVVKPIDRGQGRGVTIGIRSEEAVVHAFAVARQFTSEPILVERFVEGCDHRLLVVRGRLVAAVRREPATVVGDGASTVRELIAGLNAYRQSQPHLARYLKMVKEEAEVLDHLASQGLNPDSVPAVGRSVPLRGNANVSTGGSPTDVLHAVHPEVRSLVESIAVNLGLESVGVDYITADISRSLSDAPGCVIEVNVTPGLDLHIAASMREEEIGRIVLGSALGRIPVVLVVASIKDQRQLLNELQRRGTSLGPGTAMVGPDGTHFDLLQLEAGTLSFPERVVQVLANRQTARAVITVSPEIVGHIGLPVDRCDLSIMRSTDPAGESTRQLLRRYSNVFVDATSDPVWPSGDLIEQIGMALQALAPLKLPTVPLAGTSGHVKQTRSGQQTIGLARFEQIRQHRMTQGPVLFSIMRNEHYLLPWFLAHYRALGIENFVIYDDHSNDGTREFLEQQPDCSILTSANAFNASLSNGMAFHHYVKNVIPESLGAERWVLTVDADEFLFLPQGFSGLPSMYAYLDRKDYLCVFGTMVDFYPRRLVDRNHDFRTSPFEVSRYFDQDKSFIRNRDSIRVEKRFGGIRARLQKWLQENDPDVYDSIYKGRGYMMAAMYKVPLLKTGHNITRKNSHTVNVQPPFDIELCMAHFKFTPDLDDKIREALDKGRYYLGSIEYRFLAAALSRFNDVDLVSDGSVIFTGAVSLESAGYMGCRAS